MQLADQTKRVLEAAIEEAKSRAPLYWNGTSPPGTVQGQDTMAVAILQSLNVNREIVRRRVLNLMRQDLSPTGSSQPARASSKDKSLLEQLGTDLTEAARRGELDPVIGRQKEIERVVQILARRSKNNPALIGEPGVGKTAIVEGLAQRIVARQVPEDLTDKRLIRLDGARWWRGPCTVASLRNGSSVIEEIDDRDDPVH